MNAEVDLFDPPAKERRTFHYADLDRSEDLQKMYAYMKANPGASGKMIADYMGLMSISTWISALRHNLKKRGGDIDCYFQGLTEKRNKIYVYYIREPK